MTRLRYTVYSTRTGRSTIWISTLSGMACACLIWEKKQYLQTKIVGDIICIYDIYICVCIHYDKIVCIHMWISMYNTLNNNMYTIVHICTIATPKKMKRKRDELWWIRCLSFWGLLYICIYVFCVCMCRVYIMHCTILCIHNRHMIELPEIPAPGLSWEAPVSMRVPPCPAWKRSVNPIRIALLCLNK